MNEEFFTPNEYGKLSKIVDRLNRAGQAIVTGIQEALSALKA